MRTQFTLASVVLVVIVAVFGYFFLAGFPKVFGGSGVQPSAFNPIDFFTGNRVGSVTNPATSTPTDAPTRIADLPTFSVTTQSGAAIDVSDFTYIVATATTTPDSSTSSHVDPRAFNERIQTASEPGPDGYDVIQTANFAITFFHRDQSFNLTLMSEPVKEARLQGESKLLDMLGVDQDTACSLRYVVLVPASVNDFYAGKNLGFSFCKGATQF